MRPLAVALVALVLAPAASAAPVAASTSFSPQVHGFADPLTATVTVSVDPVRADPASVRVLPSFAPYRATALPPTRSAAAGGLVVLRFAFRLRCTDAACLPDAGERTFHLPPARVSWRARNGGAAGAVAAWPPLLVASRLTKADLAQPSFPADLAPPPARFAVPPAALGDGLLALGSLLAAAGLAVLGRLALRRRRRLVPVEPLQRALELVERAALGDVVDRRRALYQLALVLEEARLEPESSAARKLAWAPAMPDPEGMQLLSLVIREQLAEATA